MKKLKVVYLGTPDFSVPALEILSQHPMVDLCSVVSMPDRPAGRGHKLKSPEVIEFARNQKIPFFQTENINQEHAFLKKLEEEKIDLIIVLAFAQFLGQKVLDLPQIGCFNFHTSILPKYRGAAPIQYALLNGDTETGVSIQKMVKKMDAGDLVWSHKVAISPEETGGMLYTRLKYQAGLSLAEFINNIELITYTPQDESKVSFAPTLKKEDGLLDFENKSFKEIYNQIRALKPWPGTYCYLGKKRLKVYEIDKSDSNKSLKPGEVQNYHNQLLVGLRDSTVRLKLIQLEGKKVCSDSELLNGFKDELIINKRD